MLWDKGFMRHKGVWKQGMNDKRVGEGKLARQFLSSSALFTGHIAFKS